jgi:Ca-activated chloride channel family protein
VTGFRAGEPYREVIPVELPALEREHEALASIWARARIEALLRRDLGALQSGSYPEALREEVVSVALAHRLVTPFTSFVAVEDRVVNRSGRLETVTVPVEMPQGVTHAGVFGQEDAVAYGGIGAPAPMAELARVLRAPQLGAARAGSVAERAATRRERAAAEPITMKPGALPKRVRERLAPELLALLEGAEASPRVELHEGRVHVRVVLDGAPAEVVPRLEAAGLDVRKRADGWLDGWIRVGDLAALAAREGVRRVELP